MSDFQIAYILRHWGSEPGPQAVRWIDATVKIEGRYYARQSTHRPVDPRTCAESLLRSVFSILTEQNQTARWFECWPSWRCWRRLSFCAQRRWRHDRATHTAHAYNFTVTDTRIQVPVRKTQDDIGPRGNFSLSRESRGSRYYPGVRHAVE